MSKTIPQYLVDDILHRSDHTCCMCQRKDNPQIHHIDGNRSNNAWHNLIPLCPNCHSKVGQRGGSGRRYTKGELRHYKDEWFSKVTLRRQKLMRWSKKLGIRKESIFSILACFEVRRIYYVIENTGANWEKLQELAPELLYYARDFDYYVRMEVIDALSLIASWSRRGMPAKIAQLVEAILLEALPIYTIVAKTRRKISRKDLKLLQCGLDVGHNIVWDACRYLSNVEVLDAGAYILFTILRFAHLNNLKDLKKETIQIFQSCQNICDELRNGKSFGEGRRTLQELFKGVLTTN